MVQSKLTHHERELIARRKLLLSIEKELRTRKKERDEKPLLDFGRTNFEGYVRYVRPWFKWSWHHEVTCDYLDQFAKKKIRRLILEMPPRHSKSEMASRLLPGFIFGREPDSELVLASYASSLADEMNKDIQRIMDTEQYRSLFPHSKISDGVKRRGSSFARNASKFEIVDKRGVFRSVGVRGSLTGKGFHYGIIDDPIKDHIEALSKHVRTGIKNWYDTVFSTRQMEEDSSILIMMTRWHQRDLVGELLEQMDKDGDADKWTVVQFPAFCTNPERPEERRQLGEVLWKDKFSESYLKRQRANSRWMFEAMYQQQPKPQEDRLFGDVSMYSQKVDRYTLIAGIDLAYTTNTNSNYSAVFIGALHPNFDDVDVLYVERWKAELPATIQKLKALQALYPVAFGAENNGPQIGVNDVLEKEGVRLLRLNLPGDKFVKAQSASVMWNRGNIRLPEQAKWVGEFISEVSNFTGINDAEDDQVDAMVHALATKTKRPGLKT